jgi:hypothetical protein
MDNAVDSFLPIFGNIILDEFELVRSGEIPEEFSERTERLTSILRSA